MRVSRLVVAVLGGSALLAGCSTAPSLLAPQDVPAHAERRDATTTVMTGWTWCTPLAEALGRHGVAATGTQYLLEDGSHVGALLLDPRGGWETEGGLREDLQKEAQGCAERAGEATTSDGDLVIEETDPPDGAEVIGWRTVEGERRSGEVRFEELADGRVLAVGMQWPQGQEAPMTMAELTTAGRAGADRFPPEPR